MYMLHNLNTNQLMPLKESIRLQFVANLKFVKMTTISYTNDKRIIKYQQALVSLETYSIKYNDKEDDGVLVDNIRLIYASLMSDHKRIRTWVEVGGEPKHLLIFLQVEREERSKIHSSLIWLVGEKYFVRLIKVECKPFNATLLGN